MERNTVSMHFVQAAVGRLDNEAQSRVLASAGIAASLLTAPNARVTAQSFSSLWLAVSREIDDEFFGLDSRRMKVGSFALLSHAVLSSSNLDRALKQTLRGFAVFLDDIQGELTLEGGSALIRVRNTMRNDVSKQFADETFLVMVHGLACWLTGRRIPILAAEFSFPKPDHADEYCAMFSKTIIFNAAYTALRFDPRFLGAPVVQRPSTLRVFLRTAPQSVFLKYKNEGSFTFRVRKHLRTFVGQHGWPTIEGVADEFFVSVTTLRRHLESDSTSYQRIKDEVRRDAAIHYLCSTDLSVSEIGLLVGFQEPSAFRRAFKVWSDVQPGEYRRLRARGPSI
jgi:AraC-like DNA-binding protein